MEPTLLFQGYRDCTICLVYRFWIGVLNQKEFEKMKYSGVHLLVVALSLAAAMAQVGAQGMPAADSPDCQQICMGSGMPIYLTFMEHCFLGATTWCCSQLVAANAPFVSR